ncbi:DUF2892 domain-containing protein [Hahella sp. CR1]|uniref:YgaP family membrane protein n=1 Tax=Hahella sp. CR1 TaxID=2992807 RepID=UPI0024432E05|nr:DUF2892 domain-containing protein [Hahella sp. CR1]MDG9667750.1 DUF2892 domain-containing protein [Hahella sp. CR1]
MKALKKNLSSLDRTLRGVIGVVVTGAGLFGGEYIGEPIVQAILIAFGVLNLISLATGWCVVYQIAHISTLKPPAEQS